MRKSSAIVGSLLLASSILVSWRIGLPDYVEASEPISVTPSSSPDPAGGTTTETPTETPTEAATTEQPAEPLVQTIDSDEISYKYGIVQVRVTFRDSDITEVTMLKGEASNGRAEAYAMLIDATIQVQGTNYGNVTGATYTTEAFKSAIENALSKVQLP